MTISSVPLGTSLLHDLHSIVERLDLQEVFPVGQALQIELGSGDGSFLVEWARQHPGINFIGVERLLGRIRKMERKARRAGVNNLRGVRIESSYFLKYLLPEHSAGALHIYFPDPWPKRKHRKNRFVNADFPAIAQAALIPRGQIYLRTDDADYFAQMLEVLSSSPLFEPIATPPNLASVLTDFERDFQARGIHTLSAAFESVLHMRP